MTMLLALALGLPLGLAAIVGRYGPAGRLALRLAPWAAVPALALAVVAPPTLRVEASWLLFGARLGVDPVGRVFLLLTTLLWTAAGVYAFASVAAGEERRRFFLFFLLALSGNVGLVVALDLGSFYLFFAIMTFSAYGLVVHARGREAARAGRIYIAVAVVGEAMLLAGGVLAAAGAPTLMLADVAGALATAPYRDLTIGLIFAGFATKAGVVPLHVWLPLAHPVAPTPASAVLSGCMIEAGLLGWVRFLPLGTSTLPGWGVALIAIGTISALYGAAIGIVQRDPKTILAYSSVSQMGLMTTAVGVGLLDAGLAPAAIGVAAAFALHHGLVKGALFLGVGVATARLRTSFTRTLVFAGLVLAALALAGVPLTSGGLAKHHLAEVAHLVPGPWARRLEIALPLTAVATTLLLARFIQRTMRAARDAESPPPLTAGIWIPWVCVLVVAATASWVLPAVYPTSLPAGRVPDAAGAWAGVWPVLAGSILFGAGLLLASRRPDRPIAPRVPAGDLLAMGRRDRAALRRRTRGWTIRIPHRPVSWIANNWYAVYADRARWSGLLRAEKRITGWGAAGLMFVLAVLAMLAMLELGAAS